MATRPATYRSISPLRYLSRHHIGVRRQNVPRSPRNVAPVKLARPAELDRWSRLLIGLVVAGDVVAGVVLRFVTTSKLWLDEAQSVNIAAQPLSRLVGYLRHDGAPPLYYVLLHVWMGVVGSSDVEVRALSGVISVIALGLSFFAFRAWSDTATATVGTAVFAIVPYGIYFGTETRMYALVMALVAGLLWVLRRHLDRPRTATAVGIALLAAALLYTQYWSLYLLLVIGVLALARWWRQRSRGERPDPLLVGALVAGAVLWIPWVPIFNEQRLHTGTPWSPAPGLSDIFTWVDDFTVNQSIPHVISSLHTEITLITFLVLAFVGVIGVSMATRSSTMSVNLLGAPGVRFLAVVVLGTMLVGMLASHFDGAAYVPRYAAVIAVPLMFLVGRGIMVFQTPARMLVAIALLSGACLWTDKWGVDVQRSQAGPIAAALRSAPAGSIVYVCPDQLGPSLLRYAPKDLTYLGYPRFTDPSIVNWYDYLDAYNRYTPKENALRQAATISASENVYVVRAPNYGLKQTCWWFAFRLATDLHRSFETIVKLKPNGYYQPMELQQLVPVTATASSRQ